MQDLSSEDSNKDLYLVCVVYRINAMDLGLPARRPLAAAGIMHACSQSKSISIDLTVCPSIYSINLSVHLFILFAYISLSISLTSPPLMTLTCAPCITQHFH